jgi:hypothetical protein
VAPIVHLRRCRPICVTTLTTKGHHGLACRRGNGRHSRHNQVNNILCRAFNFVGAFATREPHSLCVRSDKRPDGVTQIPWRRSRCLAWMPPVPTPSLNPTFIGLPPAVSQDQLLLEQSRRRSRLKVLVREEMRRWDLLTRSAEGLQSSITSYSRQPSCGSPLRFSMAMRSVSTGCGCCQIYSMFTLRVL